MAGDDKVVNIVEDWDAFVECSGEKLGFYQCVNIGEFIELRVRNGNVGFQKEFENKVDPLLDKIIEFCRKCSYIRIIENKPDSQFLK